MKEIKHQPKQTELSILNRYLLTIGLPKQWNYHTLATVKFLIKKIRLNEAEQTDLFKHISPQWDFAPTQEMADVTQKYEITTDEKEVIKEALKALDDKWLLSELHMELYEIFVAHTMEEQTKKIEKGIYDKF